MSQPRLEPACLPMRSGIPVIQAVTALAAYFAVRLLLQRNGIPAWEMRWVGTTPLSLLAAYAFPPLALMMAFRLSVAEAGLGLAFRPSHSSILRPAIGFFVFSTLAFPILHAMGLTHTTWLGASTLAVVNVVAGIAVLRTNRAKPETAAAEMPHVSAIGRVLATVLSCALLVSLTKAHLPAIAEILDGALLVAVHEELLFRGFVQSRLNAAFGKPWSWVGTGFGPGVLITALLFGLYHPVTQSLSGEPQWAWFLWTSVFGFFMGLLREKSGGIVVPICVHAATLIPRVLFHGVLNANACAR